MRLENIVIDSTDPGRLGRFWERALGTTMLTDSDEGYETRLIHDDDGPVLDLCFPRVPTAPTERVRLHLDLRGAERQQEVVDELVGLGACHLDIGQGDVPWVVLGDVDGNAFCVMEHRDVYHDTGPIAALPLDSADPERDAQLWSWLTGWTTLDDTEVPNLRHPSRKGPVLELLPEPEPKPAAKNRMHLDMRLEPGDDVDEVAEGVRERGGRELEPDWGDLPWRVFADGSGNEFCILPAPST